MEELFIILRITLIVILVYTNYAIQDAIEMSFPDTKTLMMSMLTASIILILGIILCYPEIITILVKRVCDG